MGSTRVADLDALIEAAGVTHVIPHREDPAVLEQLRDPRVLARARELLAGRDKSRRGQAILCIERIGYVLRDHETAELLLDFAWRTKDKYERYTALLALAHCTPPAPVPSVPLLDLVRHDRRALPAAIDCLHLARHEDVEPVLLSLAADADPMVLVHVARALRHMRSDASLAALEGLLEHASTDVPSVALTSIASRLGPGVLPYARQCVHGPRFVQVVALRFVTEHGDATDLLTVIARLKKLPGTRLQYEPPEVSSLVPFLLRFPEDPKAVAALRKLRDVIAKIPPNERTWIERHAPEILA